MERKIYECVCGKRLSYDEVRAHLRVCPKIHLQEQPQNFSSLPVEEQLLKLGIKPVPRRKSNPLRSSIVFGALFVSLGISFLLGISKYYPVIIIATFLAFLIPLPQKK
ncbi:MAG TPA: hypothetical protein VGA85_05930 [Dehalococcoidales bacterium]